MDRLCRSILSFFLILCLIFTLLLPVGAAPSAVEVITTPSGFTTASEVVYVTEGDIVLNWGARGEDCTFLTTYAQSYYTDGIEYEDLSQLSGGTSATNAPDSDLYAALQDMMISRHTTFTKYGGSSALDCKKFYHYTDCMLSDPTYVSTLYRGTTVTGPWDGGKSYNQEHVWPQSKCIGTSSQDVGDLMQLRPAVPNENSSRNNTAYGESDGYYDPGISVRGDCARTLLYVYTRWGNTENLWGEEGVIENLEILLRWIAEDPVDTWEMGHNDAVQSITGVRNVFVDYPEYAWLLFGQPMPADLRTPSNSTSAQTAILVTDASSLKVGDQIILAAADYDYALSTTQNANNRGQAPITRSGDTVIFGADVQLLTLTEGTVSGTFGLSTDNGYLTAVTSSYNYLRTASELTDDSSWSINIDDTIASLKASGTCTRNTLRYNASSDIFSCYVETTTQKELKLYKVVPSQPDTTTATVVTDASALKAGDRIILIAADYDFALSTTQNTNNRGQAAITRNGTTVTFGEDTQILTLTEGTVSGTFGLSTGEGYLAAVSSSANNLKTVTDLTDNASWSITVADTIASLKASGSYTRNTLRYNASSDIFSCYVETSTQKELMICRLGSSTGSGDSEDPIIPEDPVIPDEPDTGTTATVVTNAASLKAGDRILLVAADYDFALSTGQKTNNRGQSPVVKSATGNFLTYGEDAQLLTLTEGTVPGTFGLYTGEGYLSAASSSANNLKTTTDLTDNGSFAISIDPATGIAILTASGSYSRNTLRYNATSSLFSCYAPENTMKDVKIFKLPTDITDPGLTLQYPTLSFEDEIIYNVYFSVKDTSSVVELGLMVLPKMDQNATVADATALVPGYVTNGTVYLAKSEGIPAANMGDTLYFKVYAKLTDGSYAYSAAGGYNAKAYASSILSGNNTTEMKALVVSMLNYGAEAQLYFGHNTDKLVNNALTAAQQALVKAYDATMMDALVKADPNKTTNFVRVNSNFRQLYPSVSFDGAFAINFYCAPAIKVDSGMTLYWWDMETMAKVDQLTVDNATGSMEMTDTSGMWWGQVPGIAAKEMDKTYYVTCVFESDGQTITTGVIPYSLGKYCSDKAAANGDPQQSFAQATAVYGYYAKNYFASIA